MVAVVGAVVQMQKETTSNLVILEEKFSHDHKLLCDLNTICYLQAKVLDRVTTSLERMQKFWEGLPCPDAFRLVLRASLQSLSSLSAV